MNTVKVTLNIDNVYEVTGETIHVTVEADVAEPPSAAMTDDEWGVWADAEIMPYTGTGQLKGEAGYFVEITECEEMPELVGQKFEWGI